MSQSMEREFEVRVGEKGADGIQQVRILHNGRELAERIQLEDACERVCFAARALRQVGLDVTRERLAELELRLARAGLDVAKRPAAIGDRPLRRFSQRKKEQISWLWPGRIARGAITLLAGDPGLGKSLVTLDIAARVSRGADWPDGERGLGRPGSVVLLSGEDNLETTILPRLEAMGADMNQLVTVEPEREGWSGEGPPPSFELERDMSELRRTVRQLGDCGLVVFDPISAFLGQAGECSNAVVRRVLAPLTELAQRENLAVLMVAHMRKDMGAAVRRALGSMAFMAVSRAGWLVLRDPIRPERRLMLPVKNNLANDADGLAYEIEQSNVEQALGEEQVPDASVNNGVAVVKWSEERLRMRVEEAIAESRRGITKPNRERRQAVVWLQEYLSSGARRTVDVREQAEAQGHSFATLKRAFWELGGVARKDQTSRHGAWMWALPGVGGQVEECEEVEEVSGGVEEESERQVESEAEVDGSASDVGGGALGGILPMSAEAAAAEAKLLAMIRRDDEEVAAFAARMAAEEREGRWRL